MNLAKEVILASTLIISSSSFCLAQNFDTTLVQDSQMVDRNIQIRPQVNYHENVKLVELSNNYKELNKTENTIDGYRIEIFSSSGANSKLKARNYRIQFIDKYDSIPAYVVWEYPNFEVRTGDFRTKLEAEKALALIVNEFPFAFITKDKINPPVNSVAKTEE